MRHQLINLWRISVNLCIHEKLISQKKIFIWIKKRTLIFISYLLSRCYVSRMIPLVMRLWGGVEVYYAPSRSLTISDFLNRKWVPEVQHFRPRPPPQSKIGDSPRRFPFLSLLPRRDAILDRLVEASLSPSSRIWMLVSVELSDWWRRKRDSATRIYVFTLFTKDGNLMRFMRKIFSQAWGRKFVIQFRRDFCANNKKKFHWFRLNLAERL